MHKRHLYNAAYAVIQVGISSPKLRVHSSSQWKILEACCVQGHGRFVFNNFKILFPSFGSRKMPQELLLSPWACFSLNNDVTENMFAFCLLCPLSLSPTLLQEPSWLCMSSAGCRTMPAGSCTATSPMMDGLMSSMTSITISTW